MRTIVLGIAVLVCCMLAHGELAACVSSPEASSPETSSPETSSTEISADEWLGVLLDQDWQMRLVEDPIFATRVGEDKYPDRLPDASPEGFRRQKLERTILLQQLEKMSSSGLSPAGRINFEILQSILEDELADLEMGAYRIPISDRWGFHLDFLQLPDFVALTTVADYEAYIARLKGFRAYVGGYLEVMREGLAAGWVSPRLVMEGAVKTITPQIVLRAEDSLLWQPFEQPPAGFSAAERERLLKEGREAILGSVIPGYRDLHQFLEKEYLPKSRDSIGASAMPGGEAYYAQQVRHYTTLERTPREVHEIGLAEVARIRAEMLGVMAETGFEGDFAAFLDFLRSDPRFYPKDADELLDKASRLAKRMDGELPRLFGRLPRIPYGIKPVPDYLAPNTYPAYYEQASGDGKKAGFYVVNTYDLPSRPLYELEALTLHESVPGHHLQLALQQELGELPPLRRFFGFTAFVEGWALYAERLGLEVGFYTDPYSDFGRLTYEMWRACRLVVDTGIHAFGWSRRRAIDFMAESSALSLHNITTEVDRYIGWPGQALAYKTGELTIRELRARAEKALGSGFDLRDFHDLILGSGAVPLGILEQQVDRWIEAGGAGASSEVH